MNTYTNFSCIDIPMNRVSALCNLYTACHFNGVKLEKVSFYQNGFGVTFEGFPMGDAVIHDGTNRNGSEYWETMGFPWDYDDVTKHSPVALARMLAALKRGDNWEDYKED